MQCIRPMQSREYHCATCHTCTAQYDHHCFWINNCVGKGNIVRFNVFIVLSEIALCWAGYLSVRIFILLQAGAEANQLFALNGWVAGARLELAVQVACCLVWLVVLFLAFPMLCLILVQQKNLLLGKTTYERFSKSN